MRKHVRDAGARQRLSRSPTGARSVSAAPARVGRPRGRVTASLTTPVPAPNSRRWMSVAAKMTTNRMTPTAAA